MSRLQEAVNKFAAQWQADHAGAKPPQDLLYDGTFSRQAGEEFCLCFKCFTGLGGMISFAGLSCADCLKPVTDETYAWGDEARRERAEMAS